MIHKYIKELVESNNRIIIPDFGAFMVQSTADGKQISFNDFLKFNDGLLINQIIKTEKISKNEATEKVKAFIKEIDKAFNSGNSYEIEGVGFLVKDDHGNIKFNLKPAASEPKVAATDEKPTIVLDEAKDNATPKEAEEKIAPKVKAPIKETPKPVTKTEEKPEPQKELEQAKPVTKPPVAEKVTVPVTKPSDKQSAEKIAASILDKKKKTSTTHDNSKATKLIIIIAAAVIVLGGGTWAVLTFNLLDVFKKSEPVVEVVALEPIIDSVPEEVVDTTDIVEEELQVEEEEQPKIIEESTVDPNAKRYYIVAGSFTVESNANDYSQKLISEGYDSEIVARANGYYTVSYKTIYDWDEALREWRTMRNVNSQTWILVK